MPRFIQILIVFVSMLIEVQAERFQGYIVNLNGDTIECEVFFNDLLTYSTSNEIISTRFIIAVIDGEKQKFKPEEITCYSIKVKGGTWQTYYGVDTGKDGFMYMKQEVEGKMSLYSCVTYNYLSMRYTKHFLFRKQDNEASLHIIVGVFNSLKKHYSFFDHCQTLFEKLENREINLNKYAHWILVAEHFNEKC